MITLVGMVVGNVFSKGTLGLNNLLLIADCDSILFTCHWTSKIRVVHHYWNKCFNHHPHQRHIPVQLG